MVPGPVTTLEALLGHITEHLLQLLGVAEHQRGRKEGAGVEEVRGFLRNNSCFASCKVVAVERAICACVCKGHKGRGSMVRCRLMTDSNRLKIVRPNLLSSHVNCLKVILPACFYGFTRKLKTACPLLFNLHLSKMSSYIVKFYRDTFTAFSGLGLTIKAQASNQNPLTVFRRMSESSCCIWTVTQNSLYQCFCWGNCGILVLHRLSSIIQKRCLPTTHLLMCISACASVNTFREIMKTSSFCLTLNQFRPIGPPPSHHILL